MSSSRLGNTSSYSLARFMLASKNLRTAQLAVRLDSRKLGEIVSEKRGRRPEGMCA